MELMLSDTRTMSLVCHKTTIIVIIVADRSQIIAISDNQSYVWVYKQEKTSTSKDSVLC